MSPSVHRSTCVRSAARVLPLLALLTGAPQAPAATPQPAAAAPQEPVALFSQALDASRREDFISAGALAWSYLRATSGATDRPSVDKTESATFYLGESLERLGYTQAAIDRYLEVVTERRAPQIVPRAVAALERLSRAQRYLEEAIAQGGVLTATEFEELPPHLQDFVHYRQAVDDLRRGYSGWGLRHLGRVRPESPYQAIGAYARAVWKIGRGEVDAASQDLDQIIGGANAPPEIRARALHARARLRYEKGLFKEAYSDLDQVDIRYERGEEVLREKAWAKFRARDYRSALGLLHALGAPSYAARFAPERYLLRSLIFSKFCHFRAAKRSIEQFRERHREEISQLRAGARPEDLPGLRAAAFERTADTGAGAVQQLVLRLEEEQRRIGALAAWGDAKRDGKSLNAHLQSFYNLKLQGARHQRDQLLRGAAARMATELLDANEQMNLLEYEVGMGIYRRVGQDSRLAERERRPVIPRVSDNDHYHFEGEYWSDELPDMQFFIEDRCVD